MRMQQLARAAALSASATTRLVNRLEDRGLLPGSCASTTAAASTPNSRRGQQPARGRPAHHDAKLERALAEAQEVPELAPLVERSPRLHAASNSTLASTAPTRKLPARRRKQPA